MILTQDEVIKILKKAGWKLLKNRGKGSHVIMADSSGRITTIPKGELKKGTLASIQRDTGVTLAK